MQFVDLPVEIVSDILSCYVTGTSGCPTNVLTVNSCFYELALPLVHRDLVFRSVAQLENFAGYDNGKSTSTSSVNHSEKAVAPLTRVPDSFSIELPGGTANKRLWGLLKKVILRCRDGDHVREVDTDNVSSSENSVFSDESESLDRDVKQVKLTLNSLASDPTLHLLSETLATMK